MPKKKARKMQTKDQKLIAQLMEQNEMLLAHIKKRDANDKAKEVKDQLLLSRLAKVEAAAEAEKAAAEAEKAAAEAERVAAEAEAVVSQEKKRDVRTVYRRQKARKRDRGRQHDKAVQKAEEAAAAERQQRARKKEDSLQKAIGRGLRRSPRRRSASPETPKAQVVKKLYFSAGSAGKKRKSASPKISLVRKTIGEAIKLNMDNLLLQQYFRDEDRNFRIEEFRHHVDPLLIHIMNDEVIDTSMFTKHVMQCSNSRWPLRKRGTSTRPSKKINQIQRQVP